MDKLPISVIILTYNEENNIKDCIESVFGWVEKIFVVDSYSSDKTVDIAKKFKVELVCHEFDNYSEQRNWALENLPIKTDWVFYLDADHRVAPELKKELIGKFSTGADENFNGFIMSRKTIFMGKWIKHGGHYPTYHAPLFRKNKGYCEHKPYDQHFIVDGKIQILKSDIIDIISDSLARFTERHNKWSTLEAESQLKNKGDEKEFKDKRRRRRFLRNLYFKAPLFFRACAYFTYRYIFRLGFLDGKEGLIFHFLQGFWYRFLVDAKIYEKLKVQN